MMRAFLSDGMNGIIRINTFLSLFLEIPQSCQSFL